MKNFIIIFLLALLVIVAGAAWGMYEYHIRENVPLDDIIDGIKNSWEFDESPEPDAFSGFEPPFEPIVKTPVSDLNPTGPIDDGVVPPGPKKYDIELTAAWKIMKRAERHYKKLDWPKALKTIEPLATARVHPRVTTKRKNLENKCHIFWKLLADIPPEEMNQLNGLVNVYFNNGRMMEEAELLEESPRGLRVRTKGFETEIPVDQIASFEKITPEKRKQQLKKQFQERLKELGASPTAYQYYEIGVFSYKNQLKEEVVPMLEKALAKDKNIVGTVRREEAKLLYESCLFYAENDMSGKFMTTKRKLGKKFPQSKYVTLVREISVKKPVSPVKPSDPVVVNPPKDPGSTQVDRPKPPPAPQPAITADEVQRIIDQANVIYEKGHKHYAKTKERGPDFDSENEKAYAAFKQAIRLYEQARNKRTHDVWLKQRYNDAIQSAIMARKQRRLNR